MGQAAGLVLGVAGAVVGGVLSGGALLAVEAGFLAGNLLAAILFPPKKPSPGDIRVQDSAYGKYIPRVYGKYRLAGNIIWIGAAHQHDSGGGKGMGGKGGQPYVTVSLAVGLCAGTIQAVTRIWANGKLIYDISNPSNFQAISGSAQMITNFVVYPGDENQTADPTMQSQLGASNVPAYRGLAYVVFNELNLQQWGNYLPSLSFEVVKSGTPSYTVSGAQNAPASPALQGLVSTIPRSIGTQIDNAGNVYGWQYGLSNTITNDVVCVPFKLTPYGVQWQSAPIHMGLAFPLSQCQSYDAPGIMMTNGNWVQNDGGVYVTGITIGLIGNFCAIKTGGRVYVSQFTGGTPQPVYISAPTAISSTMPPSVTVGGYSGDALLLMGVSASYIYAISLGGAHTYSLIQLDLNGNFVAVLDGPNTLVYGPTSVGYLVSDNQLYICAGTGIYLWNGTSLSNTGMPGDLSGNMSVLRVIGNVAYYSDYAFGTTFYAQVLTVNGSDLTLASVVGAECAYAGLQSTQYDTAQLTDVLPGYAVTGQSSPRDVLSPLMSTFFFDACDTGGPLKFVKRGGAPAITIPWDDLGAGADGRAAEGQNPLVETITQEFELPRQVTMQYVSANTDYQTGVQRELRAQTSSNLDESTNVPIVLADNQAKVIVQAQLWERWVKRQQFQFNTQYKYLNVESGDVVSITSPAGTTYTLRITKVHADGKNTLSFAADPSVAQIYPNPSTYVAQGGVAQGFTSQTVPYSGPSILKVLDVPPLRDIDTTQALYIATCGYNNSWPGAAIDISRDDVNFTQLLSMSSQSVIGITTTALPNFQGGNTVDELSTVTVQLYNSSHSLSSVSYASFLNGANAAYFGGEIVYFRSAVQTAPSTFVLSGFIRGMKGTEYLMGGHVAGEDFVLLDPSRVGVAGINLTDIGQPLYFEPFLLNLFGNTPGGVVGLRPANARVKPLSPWLFAATKGSAAAATDISLQWIRRARVNTSWLSGADVPIDESTESYNLGIYNGTTLVRQVVVSGPFVAPTVPNYVYTAANITADGFSTGNTITFKVYQNSDQGVPGYTSTTTIVR
ncbi:hypothetical protein DF105_00890 [Burkholderia stagnalis]|uniref:phage tail protein n=1 Tax=Burkholderia stagnalis TaxID=1503054 RepID=UPI000F5F6E59|nr:phage tail protein [Burkholderia stagnalis]RQZ08892.1 hypothetical protein DF105_00890 [Burkholderia stagnalis]